MAAPAPEPVTPSPAESPADALLRELETRRSAARLSANDARVLAFVREHVDELGFHTSESIAQGAGVSRAAVVRFSRRLGYSGFAELRNRRRELAATAPRPGADRGDGDLLARKLRRDADNLALLPELLGAQLERAAAAVSSAQTVWLLANRETQGLVAYLYRLLHQVRSNLRLVDPAFPDPLRDLDSGDALLVCTFRPYARQTIDMLTRARAARAARIIVTDNTRPPFARPNDIVLGVPVESPTMFLSFTAAVAVLEALAAAIARADPDRTWVTLEATGEFADSQRMMVELEPGTDSDTGSGGRRGSGRSQPRSGRRRRS